MINLLLILLAAILVIFFGWISPAFFGAPFEPSSNKALEAMIKLSEIKPRNRKKLKIADLGSGNGKIVIAFAKLNPRTEIHGFEINPLLVWISRRKIRSLDLQSRAFIHWKNFWNQDFKDFNIITSFQINYAMPGLEKKFLKELKKGSKVISNTWKFPTWKPKKIFKEGMVDVFLYVK